MHGWAKQPLLWRAAARGKRSQTGYPQTYLQTMSLFKKSEHICSISDISRGRYEAKVTATGLDIDPYAIDAGLWLHEPEVIPQLSLSDVMLYMVSTPSPYTKEAIKVNILF